MTLRELMKKFNIYQFYYELGDKLYVAVGIYRGSSIDWNASSFSFSMIEVKNSKQWILIGDSSQLNKFLDNEVRTLPMIVNNKLEAALLVWSKDNAK